MKNPRNITVIEEAKIYVIPTFVVTDEGIVDGAGTTIKFCKGDKSDSTKPRQEGMFTETLIETSKQYLESVNKGDLASRETDMAITKLDEALMWLQKRATDRQIRGVQGTYQK